MKKSPKYVAFGNTLGDLVTRSKRTFREIELETYQLYGGTIVVTRQDLSAYLMGDRLPRADKLAALLDVLEAKPSDVTKVLRSFPRKKPVSRN